MQKTTSQRKIVKGDWKCAECGKPITELPFEPRGANGLKCDDCFRARKTK